MAIVPALIMIPDSHQIGITVFKFNELRNHVEIFAAILDNYIVI